MGITRVKKRVWIDDGVNDINGVLVGWIDRTDKVKKDVEAFSPVYKKPEDTSKSLLYKVLGGLFKAAWKVTGSEELANKAFEVSDTIYPKSAIDGFPSGKTVTNVPGQEGTPEYRVVLREDINGKSYYQDQVWKTSDGKSVAEIKSDLEETKQRLNAVRSERDELREEVGREDDSKNQYNDELRDGYFPEEEGGRM